MRRWAPRKNHANPLRGSGYFIRIRIYRRSFSYQRHRAVCSVMASLVANGFSPGGVGGGPKAVRPPRPPPPLRGKTKGGFHLKAVYYLLAFSSFHNLGNVGKNRLFANFSYFPIAIFKYWKLQFLGFYARSWLSGYLFLGVYYVILTTLHQNSQRIKIRWSFRPGFVYARGIVSC